jgi:hypothetical protein
MRGKVLAKKEILSKDLTKHANKVFKVRCMGILHFFAQDKNFEKISWVKKFNLRWF